MKVKRPAAFSFFSVLRLVICDEAFCEIKQKVLEAPGLLASHIKGGKEGPVQLQRHSGPTSTSLGLRQRGPNGVTGGEGKKLELTDRNGNNNTKTEESRW